MNILVTGGAGFIGSNFIRYMLSKYNYNIINLDKLTYAGDLENLKGVDQDKRYHFIQGDICDRGLVYRIFKNYDIDVVINFAAESHVDRSIEDSEIFIKTNIMGTQVLLDSGLRYWKMDNGTGSLKKYKPGVKFIQISTDEVYGALGKDGFFTEDTNLAPNNPYSASKAAADMMVRAYYKTYGLPINITRCTNNYGPYQHQEKLIPLIIYNALKNKALPIYGDGKQVRDWLHVWDHSSAIDLVFHRGQIGEVYNIGGNNERENIEIVRFILKFLGKGEENIAYIEDRLGHDRRYAIDSNKIKSQLGWQPLYSFEEGIKDTIRWYRDLTKL